MSKNKFMNLFLLTVFTITVFRIHSLLTSEYRIDYIPVIWNYNYKSIKEISQMSDLIAIIRVQDKLEESENNGNPYTIYSAEILYPIYNSLDGEIISIKMSGIHNQYRHIEIKNDPLLEKEQEFLIFAQQENNYYIILGGPQGRLHYADGKINSLHAVNKRVKEAGPIANINIVEMDFEILYHEIKGYVDN